MLPTKRQAAVLALLLVLLAMPLLRAADPVDEAPSSLSIVSPTLEIGFPTTGSLIQFFYVPHRDDDPNIEVYLSHRSTGQLETTHLETIGPEGRAAEIVSVFTLDVDKDGEAELFILASWPITHTAIGTEGTYYRVYVYRRAAIKDGGPAFSRARDIEERFGSGLDGVREGVRVSFPYKDYESVKAAIDRRE